VLGTVLVMVSISCLDPAETFLLNICFASLSGIWFWGPLLVFFLFIYFRSRNHSATLRMNSITPSKANEQMRSVKDEARADKKKTIERREKKRLCARLLPHCNLLSCISCGYPLFLLSSLTVFGHSACLYLYTLLPLPHQQRN
jgi:hypothetical protein